MALIREITIKVASHNKINSRLLQEKEFSVLQIQMDMEEAALRMVGMALKIY
jgi:hypothetical protein